MPELESLQINYIGTEITEKDLSNPDKLEAIVENMSNSIEQSLKSVLIPARNMNNRNSPSYEGSNMYDRIYVDGRAVSYIAGLMLADTSAYDRRRDKLQAIIVADAHIRGAAVTANPFGAPLNEEPRPIIASGALPKMSASFSFKELWLKFCAFFNFGNSRAQLEDAERERRAKETSGISAMRSQEMAAAVTDKPLQRENEQYYDSLYIKYKNFAESNKQIKKQVMSEFTNGKRFEEKFDPKKVAQGKAIDPNYMPTLRDLPDTKLLNHRSCDVICLAMMLLQGHTLKNLADPSHLTNSQRSNQLVDKSFVGLRYLSLTKDLLSSDETTAANAKDTLKDILVEGTKKFLEQEAPSREEYCNFTNADKPFYVSVIPDFAKTMFQELNASNQIGQELMSDPAVALLRAKVGVIADMGPGRSISKASTVGTIPTLREDKVKNRTLALELGRKFGVENMNYADGSTLGQLAYLNQKSLSKPISFDMHFIDDQNIISTYFDENAQQLVSYSEIFEGADKRVTALAQTLPAYSEIAERHERKHAKDASIEEKETKLALATKTINSMMSVSGQKSKPQEELALKNKMILSLLKKEEFINLTDNLPAHKLEELNTDQSFFDKIINSLAAEKKQENKEAKPEKHEKLKEKQAGGLGV